MSHGIYTQPGNGGKALAGALRFQAWAGVDVAQVLDFTPRNTWAHISRYLPLSEWRTIRREGMRLQLSVPLIPDDGSTLAQVAAGQHDQHFAKLAENLTAYDLADTVVRLGWEFNGGWYPWNARDGREDDYREAFRRAVTVMRSVGDGFLFDFCAANATTPQIDYDRAWPGDDVVDVVGVDVYDSSWPFYPVDPADTAATIRAHANAWAFQLGGDQPITDKVRSSPIGLQFWADFARLHGKLFAVDEWGVTWQSDGHGGNDNPSFIDRVADFIAAPSNNVAWANYFEIDVPGRAHVLSSAGTRFPLSAGRYLARARDIAGLGGGR